MSMIQGQEHYYEFYPIKTTTCIHWHTYEEILFNEEDKRFDAWLTDLLWREEKPKGKGILLTK